MFQNISPATSMFLSPQEAMDLLDICVISQADTDPDKARVIRRLTDFVRQCIVNERRVLPERTVSISLPGF
jgi:hypothetical protein